MAIQPTGKLIAAMNETVEKPNAGGARERIMTTAYELFARFGTRSVGVDTIIAKSGVAKMSLYRHFRSKQALVEAFMERREERWTLAWLRADVEARAETPEARLLAVFDVFDGWFRTPDFEGCSFINILLEYEPGNPLRDRAIVHLANIRAFLRELAEEAGLANPEAFAATWHILMKGSIVSAGEGNREAARHAREAARMVLAGWPRIRG
jgi:AcrR family transcriptional regulator